LCGPIAFIKSWQLCVVTDSKGLRYALCEFGEERELGAMIEIIRELDAGGDRFPFDFVDLHAFRRPRRCVFGKQQLSGR
jgi:hypothetical protein